MTYISFRGIQKYTSHKILIIHFRSENLFFLRQTFLDFTLQFLRHPTKSQDGSGL